MSFANITIGGYLGKDAQQFTTPNGKTVTRFTVAVTTGYREHKTTNWYECALWGEQGNRLLPYLTKGKAVVVSGELSMTNREYQGKNYPSLNVTVDRLAFAGGKPGGGEQQQTNATETNGMEDIPF